MGHPVHTFMLKGEILFLFFFFTYLFLAQLKSLETKHELLQEDSKKILFYLQAILVAFLSFAFMTLIWYYLKEPIENSACNCVSSHTETFQSENPSDHRPSLEQEL